eukprot:TRINITY_DN567_c0_g2_i1.p1 TRINITY_DN567_c0_g2~~TRINITY_DN567_c0_g2_i1.p1  ORF type:complete len:343 (-),score=28.24 TRINITY_DN567_c0_g2_i1:55-1020(-)
MAKPVQRRAAFDIGSGATKLMIASVNGAKIDEQLFGQEVPVGFAIDWKQSKDGNLSDAVQGQGLNVLKGFLSLCDEHDVPKDMRCAIATEVFRKASNGAAYLDRVRNLGLPVRMLSQAEEAEIGFKTAVALQSQDASKVLCWDSGGASFQITSRDSDGGLRSYLGSLGTGVTTSLLVENVKGGNLAESLSPNPVGLDDAMSLVELLKTQIPTAPEWLHGSYVTAIGGPNCMFCVASEALGVRKYQAADVRRAVESAVVCSDADMLTKPYCQGELREPPAYIVPKLCQLLAVIEHCCIREVSYHSCIGSCPGMLISDELFTQ